MHPLNEQKIREDVDTILTNHLPHMQIDLAYLKGEMSAIKAVVIGSLVGIIMNIIITFIK